MKRKLSSLIFFIIILILSLTACTKENKKKEKITPYNKEAKTSDTEKAPDIEKEEDDWGIKLEAINLSPSGLSLKCSQSNGKPSGDLQTGSYYLIEKHTEGKWQELDYKDKDMEIGWTEEAWIIPKNQTVEWQVNWEWLYGELPSGDYRIGKEIMDFRETGDYDKKIYYAEFTIN